MSAPTDKTREDLARAALTEIRVLRGGEAPTAVAKAQADQKYDAIYSELAHLGVAFWDRDAIPVAVFDPMSMMVAQRLAPSFGKEYSAGDAMARLRLVAAKPWSGKVVAAEYF